MDTMLARSAAQSAVQGTLDLVPTRVISDGTAAALGSNCCAICLETYAEGEELACMPCAGLHIEHAACLRRWIADTPSCPRCRYMLPARVLAAADREDLLARPREALEHLRPSAPQAACARVTEEDTDDD